MIVTLALSVLIGISLGLLGGGGSILTVPILVYAAGLDPRDGIATSLLVVGATSLSAMATHARAGRVSWRVGVLFGGASMVGAYAGGQVAHFVPGRALLVAFTVTMVVTALAMMRKRGDAPQPTSAPAGAVARSAVIGLGIGALTGIVGAGGGFVIVPALVLLGGLPMRSAVGTSLLVIAMNSFAGFAGTIAHATIPWGLALSVTAASVAGSLLGARLAGRIRPESLRASFAWFVLAMACFMVVKQLPPSALAYAEAHLGAVIGIGAIAAAAAVFVLVRVVVRSRQCSSKSTMSILKETRS